jgi:hypothetical protein
MDELIDNIARILATPMPRRKAVRVIGRAFVTAAVAGIGVRRVSAATCVAPTFSCGNDATAPCCARNQCCALKGTKSGMCCNRGYCVCSNGTCPSSSGGPCPTGCFLCTAS